MFVSIQMKDGRIYEGKIVSRSKKVVVLDDHEYGRVKIEVKEIEDISEFQLN